MRRVLARNGQVDVEQLAIPAVPDNGYLVKGLWSLISPGTELDLIADSLHGATRPLGYSLVGHITAVGPAAPALPPHQCVACAGYQWAWHADVVAMPPLMVTPVPADVEPKDATFTTLGAVAIHAIRQARLSLGERVVVIGLGLVGQLVAQVARSAGALVAGLETIPARRDMALHLGAERAVDPGAADIVDQIWTWTDGLGADAVFLCTSSGEGVVELACDLVRDRGCLVIVGTPPLNVPRGPFFAKELHLTIARAYGPGRYDPVYEEEGIDYPPSYVRWTQGRNRAEFLRLLARRQVKVTPLITHLFDIAHAAEAYALLRETPASAMGILLGYRRISDKDAA